MGYKIIITDKAKEQTESIAAYLYGSLKNTSAVKHFLENLYSLYDRLTANPKQFSLCRDYVLKKKGYRKAVFSNMKYCLIFKLAEDEKEVYIMGIFHGLENYTEKI